MDANTLKEIFSCRLVNFIYAKFLRDFHQKEGHENKIKYDQIAILYIAWHSWKITPADRRRIGVNSLGTITGGPAANTLSGVPHVP